MLILISILIPDMGLNLILVDWDKIAIAFRVDVSSSVHIANENKDFFILGEGPTQGLDDAKLRAEAEYFINFSRSQKQFF